MRDGEWTATLIERAKALVPVLRDRALEAERAGRIQDRTIADVEALDFMRMMVPARFGGLGLGITALCEVSRVLAQGDTSAAWVISFLIEHNWLACRLPLSAQESLYRDASHVNAASTLQPTGIAERVDGGFILSGRWSYASGIHNSQWTFVNARVAEGGDGERQWILLIPVDGLVLSDDWQVFGMAATGSASFTVDGLFVPQDHALPIDEMHSAADHPGAGHAEPVYRYPVLPAAAAMLASFPLGAAQGAIALARQGFETVSSSGTRPFDRDTVALRWADAHQRIRAAELLWRDLLARIEDKGDREEGWSDAEMGQIELDRVSIVHGCRDAIALLMDGSGSRAARLDAPLQRAFRDVQVLANHVAHEHDVVLVKGARLLLG